MKQNLCCNKLKADFSLQDHNAVNPDNTPALVVGDDCSYAEINWWRKQSSEKKTTFVCKAILMNKIEQQFILRPLKLISYKIYKKFFPPKQMIRRLYNFQWVLQLGVLQNVYGRPRWSKNCIYCLDTLITSLYIWYSSATKVAFSISMWLK